MSADIVVVGGGPVGLAFAIAASRLQGVRVEVVERATETWDQLPEQIDHRVYALSPSSTNFLAQFGVIPEMSRVAPVRAMQVWGDSPSDDASRLQFGRGGHLASIVEHAVLMHALRGRLATDGMVNMRAGAAPAGLSMDGSRRLVTLQDGGSLAGDLIIAADGRQSRIRELAGIPVVVNDYKSDGIVGNLRCEKPHGDIARQWFTANGVLALLPLPGGQVSMVWSVSRELSSTAPAEERLALAARIGDECGHALGEMSFVSRIDRFPLARITASRWVEPGLALIGDAAHAVHPLAGQGVNLGFGDVAALCGAIGGRSRFSGVGDVSLLRQYERGRREAAWAVGQVTEGLRSLFSSEARAAKWFRNGGLEWVERVPPAKSLLIDYATG